MMARGLHVCIVRGISHSGATHETGLSVTGTSCQGESLQTNAPFELRRQRYAVTSIVNPIAGRFETGR